MAKRNKVGGTPRKVQRDRPYFMVGRLTQTLTYESNLLGQFDLDLTDEECIGYVPVYSTAEQAEKWADNGKFEIVVIKCPEEKNG